MPLKEPRKLRIRFSSDKISFTKSDTSSDTAEFDSDKSYIELTVSRIFHKALNKSRVEGLFEKDDFEVLGKILFKLLCPNDQSEARTFVYNELKYILRAEEERGRIFLQFDKYANDRAYLPWEYLKIDENLHENVHSFYLGANAKQKFDLIRLVDKKAINVNPTSKIQRKLVIAVMVCTPDGHSSFELNEFGNIFDKLKDKYNQDDKNPRFIIWEIKKTSLDMLEDEFRELDGLVGEQEDYILHIYGHARMRQDERQEIAEIGLAQDGETQWVGKDFFASFFNADKNYKRPLICVFQACESGQLTRNGEGFALSLIENQIPHVLAMQNEITTRSSNAFFYKFYESLLNGEDFFTAVTIGRIFLGCEFEKESPQNPKEHFNNNTFGSPVVFSSTMIPARFFDKEIQQKEEHDQRILICPECNVEYAYSPNRDSCSTFRCSGIPILKLTEVRYQENLKEIDEPQGIPSTRSSQASSGGNLTTSKSPNNPK
ncbi:MAG: CHAT domain-containing protein [Bacteroidia bacterium]|nr:CHAT domain-containing protein [Bacteroidia bacterium]